MFICKSKNIINEYYKVIFKWLNDCEKIFGFELNGYGKNTSLCFFGRKISSLLV